MTIEAFPCTLSIRARSLIHESTAAAPIYTFATTATVSLVALTVHPQPSCREPTQSHHRPGRTAHQAHCARHGLTPAMGRPCHKIVSSARVASTGMPCTPSRQLIRATPRRLIAASISPATRVAGRWARQQVGSEREGGAKNNRRVGHDQGL